MEYKAVFSQEYDEDVILKKKQNRICELLNCKVEDIYEIEFEWNVKAYTTSENFDFITENFDDFNEDFIPYVINDCNNNREDFTYIDDFKVFFFKRN